MCPLPTSHHVTTTEEHIVLNLDPVSVSLGTCAGIGVSMTIFCVQDTSLGPTLVLIRFW